MLHDNQDSGGVQILYSPLRCPAMILMTQMVMPNEEWCSNINGCRGVMNVSTVQDSRGYYGDGGWCVWIW